MQPQQSQDPEQDQNRPEYQPQPQALPVNPYLNRESLQAAPVPSPFESALVDKPLPDKKTAMLTAAGIIAAILLVAGAVGAYVLFGMVTPEERFERAISNHMQTKYIKQDYKVEAAATKVAMTSASESDFSNPASPKTKASYSISVGNAGDSDMSDTVTFAGNIVIEDSSGFYARLTKMPPQTSRRDDREPAAGQWYKIEKDDAISKLNFDFAGIGASVNTPLGEFIVGNYDKSFRGTLLDFIKENKVYTIKNSQEEQLNGSTVTVYTLEANYVQLAELNKKVANNFKLDFDASQYTVKAKDGPKEWLITVDNKSERIVKAHLERTVKNSQDKVLGKDTSDMTISYPSKVEITKPSDPKSSPLAFDL